MEQFFYLGTYAFNNLKIVPGYLLSEDGGSHDFIKGYIFRQNGGKSYPVVCKIRLKGIESDLQIIMFGFQRIEKLQLIFLFF